MPQSLSNTLIHVIFSTKERRPILLDQYRDELHAYLSAILKKLDCPVVAINSVEDHVHILFSQHRTKSQSEILKELKQSSSKWMKTKPELPHFTWQGGYGAFSVSASQKQQVVQYIAKQKEHHHRVSFKEEFREFLIKHGVSFDERYVWD